MSSFTIETWWILLLTTFTILILVGAFVVSLITSNRRLKRERNFSTSIVDTNPALIIALDHSGKILRFNKSCELLSGYRSDEVIGRYFKELPLVRDEIFSTNENPLEIQKEKIPIYFESQWINKNGKKCTIAWSAIELEDSIGDVKWIITGIDITDRKRFESELSESRMRLELALKGSMGGLWDLEFGSEDSAGRLPDDIYLSPQLKGFIGYEDNEFPNSLNAWHQRILPEDLRAVQKELHDHLEGKSELFEANYRIYHKDGSIRWLLSRGKIKRSEYGTPVRWTGIDWDITARKKAEEALYESEERLRTVMEKIPLGVLVAIDGKFEYSNPTLCKLTGFSNEELRGKSILDFVHEKDRKKAERRINNFFKKDREFSSEYTLVNRNGNNIPVEVDSRQIFFDGKIGLLGIIRDISERKKSEEALNKYHKQLQMLSSHLQSVREEERARISREIHDELGQTLSILLLDVGWLEKFSPQEKRVQIKLKSMFNLIELTIKKIQQISSELRPSLLDNLGLIAAIEWQAREFEKKSGISCKVHIGSRQINVDPKISTIIFRIFQESLTNILRHSLATEVGVILTGKSHKLFLEIRDNGIGITEEQINNPKSLGLLGIQERARSINGEFEIHGIPQKGTVLSVNIPVNQKEIIEND